MNKKIKTLLVAGLITVMGATNVVSANALSKSTLSTSNSRRTSYIYINGVKVNISTNKPSNNNKPSQDNSNNTTNKPSQDTTTSNGDFSNFQQEVLRLVNVERSKRGLKPLKLNTKLSSVATTKSQDMVNKNYFSHTSPTYGSPFNMMKQFGISYSAAAENIAKGQTTPEQVMKSWMNSSGHRANILSANYTELGVGVAKSSNETTYWTQMFIKPSKNNSMDNNTNNNNNNNNTDTNKPSDDVKPGEENNTSDDNNNNNNNDNNTSGDNTNNDNNNGNTNKPSQDENTTTGQFPSFQQEVLRLVNVERSKRGLKPLTLNTKLSSVATTKSQDMINKNYFSHTSPTYGSPFDMMKQFGISYRSAAENIAKGQTTPAQVMNSWMNSSGHRANILSANYTELGVGIAKSSNGTIYWTQMFIGK
ncbi:MAG: CAP domain-containing protein [Terrisporobacter sp.]